MIVALLLLLQILAPEAETRDGAEALRLQSQTLAASGDTTGAIAALNASLSGGWKSPQALLALGDLHIARGEAGLAVLALERASRLAPTDARIASARTRAYGLAGQVPPEAPGPLVASRLVTARVGAGVLVALALTLYLGAVVLAFLWRRRQKPLAGWGAIAMSPLALAGLVLAGLALWDAGQPRAVALATVDAKARPAPEASGAGVVREGEIVEIRETQGMWRRVQSNTGDGWVPARAVERF